MSGQTALTTLIAGMSPELHPDIYVFAAVAAVPEDVHPVMQFKEAEGITLILPEAEAAGLTVDFRCRMITLNIHSSLDAVGFLARITTALAASGMGVNPVSGFYHDHLFVPADRAGDAMAVLQALAAAGGN